MPVVWLAAIILVGIGLVQILINVPLGVFDLVGQVFPTLGWLLLLGLLAWFLGD
jgi:uncharacterized membrane protein YkvI